MKLENVWSRWCIVLDLIVDNGRGNCLAESKRGKLFRALPDEAEIIEDVLHEEETELNLLEEAVIDDSY